MVKYCQNKLKFHLVVEKDRGNTWKKNQENKISQFFLAIFLEVSVFMLTLVLQIPYTNTDVDMGLELYGVY
jgi:hypothetical protein